MATHARGPDLPLPDRGARRPARPAPDDRAQRGAARHRVHRLASRRARASRPASRPPTAATRSRSRSLPTRRAHDLVQPGHVFPLRAKPGGVLERIGQTEAAVDLARLAGAQPVRRRLRDHERRRDDGPRARPRRRTASGTACKMITVADLVEYRRRHEKLVERGASVRLPDRVRRVHGDRLPREADRQDARRAREGRRRRRRERARPRPLRVPHRRRLPFAALRLRRAARAGARADRGARGAACCSTWRRRAAGSAC